MFTSEPLYKYAKYELTTFQLSHLLYKGNGGGEEGNEQTELAPIWISFDPRPGPNSSSAIYQLGTFLHKNLDLWSFFKSQA